MSVVSPVRASVTMLAFFCMRFCTVVFFRFFPFDTLDFGTASQRAPNRLSNPLPLPPLGAADRSIPQRQNCGAGVGGRKRAGPDAVDRFRAILATSTSDRIMLLGIRCCRFNKY